MENTNENLTGSGAGETQKAGQDEIIGEFRNKFTSENKDINGNIAYRELKCCDNSSNLEEEIEEWIKSKIAKQTVSDYMRELQKKSALARKRNDPNTYKKMRALREDMKGEKDLKIVTE